MPSISVPKGSTTSFETRENLVIQFTKNTFKGLKKKMKVHEEYEVW